MERYRKRPKEEKHEGTNERTKEEDEVFLNEIKNSIEIT